MALSSFQQFNNGLHIAQSLFSFPFVKGVTRNKKIEHSSSEAWLVSNNRQGSHCIPRHNTLYPMKDNTTKMKCVSFPLDVFGKFRSAEPELAGEVFQYILNYVVDGDQKHFTDPYKEMLFESLLEPIRPQMTRYSERAEQCQEMARERKKSQKTPRKKNEKVAKENENVGDGNVIDANAHELVNTTDDNVTVDNVGVTDTDINETSTCDNVEPVVEDVSFTTFMSIYEHQDKGGFDTESV